MTPDHQPSVCDVVGCVQPSAGTYLDTRDAQYPLFAVCADHLERLTRGEQPETVLEHVEPAQGHARPALVMD